MFTFMLMMLLVSVLLLWFSKFKQDFWSSRGITGPFAWPFFGNLLEVVVGRKHYCEVYQDIYNDYLDAAYVGIYKMSTPAVLIRDLDLVKEIMQTNFQSFDKNDFIVDEKIDPLISKDPFAALPEKWKHNRGQMSPVFTLSKIKRMSPIMVDTSRKLLAYIEAQFLKTGKTGISLEIEAKSLCSYYTIDVVAASAFGVDSQMFNNPNSEFYTMTTSVFGTGYMNSIKNFITLLFPSINDYIQMPFVSKKMDSWLRAVVNTVLENRKTDTTKSNDFLQAILDYNSSKGLTEDEIVGYALTLLLEGYETSSTLMGYCLYELASNPDVQENVFNELQAVLTDNPDHLTIDDLEKLEYMENVMSETLRLHPPVLTLNKVCTKAYKLPPQYKNSDKLKGITIQPETPIVIPSNAIHMDPLVYENPTEFNPDRFSADARQELNKCAFLPFGLGPRMCFGMKFGLLQSKYGLVSILQRYQLKLSKRTENPLRISKQAFLLSPVGGLWLEFIRR